MNEDKLDELEGRLEVKFKNRDLLKQALTHRSYLNENTDWQFPHNERLEFLGDAVLELAVTDHLYENYDLPEGELTNLRAAVVRGEALSEVANELDLSNWLYLSRGERKDTGKARQYILANAVEAVIGAVYLDQGYEAAEKLIGKLIVSRLEAVIEAGSHIDNKSKFQEIAQEKWRITPTYRVLSETGLDHAKKFTVGVFVGKEQKGQGVGSNKQEAQQKAAKEALTSVDK